MYLLDLLWGKKSIINDGYFGEVTSKRSKQKDLNKEVTWYYEKQDSFSKDIPTSSMLVLMLEQNSILASQKTHL
jgi:hypothetical protein